MAAPEIGSEDRALSAGLVDFIEQCPSPFHTVAEISRRLEDAGFVYLPEQKAWEMVPGGRYYTTRNGSSVVAFTLGHDCGGPYFSVCVSHSDSPTFKVKHHAEKPSGADALCLNVEPYGGLIDRTWLDRPLSVAGRALVEEGGCISHRLLCIDEDLLLIPSLAIHLNRDVNQKGAIDRKTDIYPLVAGEYEGSARIFDEYVAHCLGVSSEQVLSRDLYLYPRTPGCVWGIHKEFVSSPRLDDLQCAFGSLTAFLEAETREGVGVFACLDNEEVGSGTRQGALSTFVPDVLRRVCLSLGMGEDGYQQAVARSFVVSADNAQATHPNHPELYDKDNGCRINGGVVIKENAAQLYATDAVGRAFFTHLCRLAGASYQTFANRSDLRGGSTLGNLLNRQLGARTVDVGLPQLAMHSSYETAGTLDTGMFVRVMREFYCSRYRFGADGSIEFEE